MGTLTPPGRLGDPTMCLATDPADRARGRDATARHRPARRGRPGVARLAVRRPAGLPERRRTGFAGLIDHLYGGLDPVVGVTRSTETIDGVDGNAITLYIHRLAEPRAMFRASSICTAAGWRSLQCRRRPVRAMARRTGRGAASWWSVSSSATRVGALGPYPFPAGLDDCTSALLWMHAQPCPAGRLDDRGVGRVGRRQPDAGDRASGPSVTARSMRSTACTRSAPTSPALYAEQPGGAAVAARERRLLPRAPPTMAVTRRCLRPVG